MAAIAAIAILYVAATEAVKTWFYRGAGAGRSRAQATSVS
jgi:hypothetical protein